MDKATPTPSPSVENVMSLAFELARVREKHGAQSDVYLSEVRALRAEVERLAAQAAPPDTQGSAFGQITREHAHQLWLTVNNMTWRDGLPVHVHYAYALLRRFGKPIPAQPSQAPVVQPQAVRMLTPEEPEKCYSLDEETFYDLGELIDMLDEEQAKPGFLVYEGESVRHAASHYARGAVADLFERMGEQAFDDAGEHIGDWPDHAVKDDNSAELEKLIYDWLDANVKVHFYTVKNVRQIALTADMLGDDDTGRTIPASGEIGGV